MLTRTDLIQPDYCLPEHVALKKFTNILRNKPEAKNLDDTRLMEMARMFLRARKFNVQRAQELFEKHHEMRRMNNIAKINPLMEGLRKELLSEKFTIVTPTTGANAIGLFSVHKHFQYLSRESDLLQSILYQVDVAMTREQAQLNGFIFVFNLSQARMENVEIGSFRRLFKILSGSYPVRVRKILLVGLPTPFKNIVTLATSLLSKKMSSRMTAIDQKSIFDYLSPDELPRSLGGIHDHDHVSWLRECLTISSHIDQVSDDYFEIGRHHHAITRYPVTRTLSNASFSISSSVIANNNNSRMSTIVTTLQPPNSGILSLDDSAKQNRMYHSMRVIKPLSVNRISTASARLSSSGRNRSSTPMVVTATSCRVAENKRDSPMPDDDSSSSSKQSSMLNGGLPCKRPNASNLADEAAANKATSSASGAGQLHAFNADSVTMMSCAVFLREIMSSNNPSSMSMVEMRLKTTFERYLSHLPPMRDSYRRFLQADNTHLNRYKDVVCLDASQVELTTGEYIHANWVHGYKQPRKFILTQGPLANTVKHFWQMIWETQCPTVVMLTRVFENGRLKCHQYWPSQLACKSYPLNRLNWTKNPDGKLVLDVQPYQVKLIHEQHFADSEIARCDLEVMDTTRPLQPGRNPVQCSHFLFLGWPDFDVPTDLGTFLHLIDLVNEHHDRTRPADSSPGEYPMVVHCSAGIGRAGTYAAVDVNLNLARAEGRVDLVGSIVKMRQQRAGAVQVHKQFVFINQVIAHYISSSSTSL